MSRTIRQIVLLASLMALLVAIGTPFVPPALRGQVNNNAGNNNVGGNNAGGNNAGGNAGGNRNAAGIKIDTAGIISLALTTDAASGLDRKRRDAIAKKLLNADVNVSTKTRFVSLIELERTIEKHLAAQTPIPDEAFFMAGLQRIEEVLVLPESKDLVIAGPAEGFAPDITGRMIGVSSGRPTLRLDDMVVALRTIQYSRDFGCSIDPVPERLAALQNFIQQGVPSTPDVVEARFKEMDDILGLQNVRVDGVPPDSHFSVAMVEADYRMKRISLGLENPGVKGLKSHLAMVGTGGNSIQRWWFVPLYDGIYRTPDGLAFRFAGPRAQLLAEEELADALGNRSAAASTRLSTKAFAKQFTEKFPELAEKSPIFGELQNLIDWAVFAALLQKERLPSRVQWKMATYLDGTRLTVPTFNVPKKVPSLVNYKRASSQVVGLVGGVVVEPNRVLEKMATGDDERLQSAREAVSVKNRAESHRWWWDVEK